MKTYYKILDAMPAQITVDGWMKNFLLSQKEGLPGHLHEIGYPFNKPCWKSRTMTEGGKSEWWPFEQSGYWVDALVRTAAVLKDDSVLAPVLEQIEASVESDGEPFMGPMELKALKSNRARWSHAVYFRALWAMYLYTGDRKYTDRMLEHCRADENDYDTERNIAFAETLYRLADLYEDKDLYKKANRAMRLFDQRNKETAPHVAYSDYMPHKHGVTLNEDGKMGAVSYLYTGNRKYLEASIHAYEKLADFYEMPDGLHTCYEYVTGNESFKAHESCDLSDYTYSLSFLLKATGDGKYADRMERVILNALPGSIGPDYKTIQYFSGVNQVITGRNNSWLRIWENTPRMGFQAHHFPECCIANIGRAFPNYCLNMYGDTEAGLCVNFYGASSFKGKNISVTAATRYPFEEQVTYTVDAADEKKNMLKIRIPGWTKGYDLTVNGKRRHLDPCNGYIQLRVHAGDELKLQLHFGLMPHHSSDGGIWYSFGPLTMALRLREIYRRDEKERRQTEQFPSWNVSTDEAFAFALSGYECPEAKITWKQEGENPYWDGSYPIEIKLPAKKLNHWDLVHKKNDVGLKGKEAKGIEGADARDILVGATVVPADEELVQTPRIPSADFVKENLGEDTEITLVPYGCTRLRLTVFPKFDFDC